MSEDRERRWLAFYAIVVFALGLRTGLASLAPIAERVDLQPGLSTGFLGLLAATPAFTFAIAGLFTGSLVRRWGPAPVVLGVIGVNAIAHLARGFSTDMVGFLLATAALMLAVGVGNVLLPVLVKTSAPDRIGAVTAAYTAALAVSTGIPAGLAPILLNQGGWRFAVGIWAVISILSAVPWLWMLLRSPYPFVLTPRTQRDGVPLLCGRKLHRSRTALAVLGAFMVASVTAYTMFGLFPLIAVDVWQLEPKLAGLGLSLFALMGIPLAFTVPRWAPRPLIVKLLVMLAGGALFGGFAFMVTGSATLWIPVTVALGVGTLCFPLSLALIAQTTRTPELASSLSAFVNGWGYFASGLGPIIVGAMHAWFGSWIPSLIALGLFSLLAFPIAIQLGKGACVDDEMTSAQAP